MKHLLYLIFFISIISCGTQMKLIENLEKKLPSLKHDEDIVVIEENKIIDDENIISKIGTAQIKDGGMTPTSNCTYDLVKRKALNKALNAGGNAIKITNHKLPSQYTSTCHRVTFDILKIKDISKYQKEKTWKTKISWNDFKGSPQFDKTSEICNYIDIYFEQTGNGKGNAHVIPKIIFDCSYVQPLKKNEHLLLYNQIKFNLLEISARKIRKEIKESNISTLENWNKFIEEIYNKAIREYKTDIYNIEVDTQFGENYTNIQMWKLKTDDQLKLFNDYLVQ